MEKQNPFTFLYKHFYPPEQNGGQAQNLKLQTGSDVSVAFREIRELPTMARPQEMKKHTAP